MKKLPNKRTLILIPDPRTPGGVTNYYQTLRFDKNENIDYFQINKAKLNNKSFIIIVLFWKYLTVFYKMLLKKYHTLVINPSLDLGKSFHRDALFIIIARFLNKKPIVFFHGWFDPYEEKIKNSKWEQFVFRLSYAKVKNYIVLGTTFKNKLQQLGVAPDATFHIETMVADSTWLKQLNICRKLQSFEKEISILFLSRIEKEKGLFITIDSFQRFAETQTDKNVTLIIAGDGPDLETAKKYVEGKALANVKFLGHVSGNDKMQVLLESHILMLPSYTEGLPNVILEGMLYGMPVVARATGGIPEIVKQGINGYVSESFDPEIFAGYLTTLCSDINLYKTISERNHLIAKENYTSEKVRERVLKIIQD